MHNPMIIPEILFPSLSKKLGFFRYSTMVDFVPDPCILDLEFDTRQLKLKA